MTGPATPSRARLALALLRALTVATLIVVAYYVTPLRVTVDLERSSGSWSDSAPSPS